MHLFFGSYMTDTCTSNAFGCLKSFWACVWFKKINAFSYNFSAISRLVDAPVQMIHVFKKSD